MIPLLALVVAAAFWASSNILVKVALDGLPPMTVLFVQLTSATVALWVAHAVRGLRRPPDLRAVALMGVLEPGITAVAVTFGLLRTTASSASLVGGMEPVFVAVLGWLVYRERPGRPAVVALVVVTTGMLAVGGALPDASAVVGDMLIMGGVLSAAGYVVIASRAAHTTDALTLTSYQFLFGLLASVPFVLAQWTSDGLLGPTASAPWRWVAAVLAGVVGLAAAFFLYNVAIAQVSLMTAGLSLALIPAFGFAGSVALLDDPTTTLQMLGAVAIVAGLTGYGVVTSRRQPVPGSG